MDSKQINKIRKHFIKMAMISFLIAILFIGIHINLTMVVSMRLQVSKTLDFILENPDGTPPGVIEYEDPGSEESIFLGFNPLSFGRLKSRQYFTVKFDSAGNPDVSIFHLENVEAPDAVHIAEKVLSRHSDFGRYLFFFYKYEKTQDGMLVACLDQRDSVFNMMRMQFATVLLTAVGLIISWFFVTYFSRRLVQPLVDNSYRQKQFITNASHELKTPLSVIKSNTELMEMMNGPSEWTQANLKQVDRLNGLIQNLVMIARSEEQEMSLDAGDINVSKTIEDSAEQFIPLAERSGHEFSCEITPDLHLTANASSIQMLSSVLIDNAIKYCDEGGKVIIALDPDKGGRVLFSVSNTFKDGADTDYTRFFERFFRADQSHSVGVNTKSGYGVGLSLAENICSLYNGSIKASWKDGMITFSCRLSSLKKD